jgi:exodeoxyribonuclease VII small subunit
MADESYSFSTARTRLEAIVTQVRKKDTSLEKSLDLLEEGVRLANACTELIDHADWVAAEGAIQSVGDAGETAAESEPDVIESEDAGEAKLDAVAVAEGDAGGSDSLDSDERIDAFDPAEEAWADEVPADDLGADDDPSADER